MASVKTQSGIRDEGAALGATAALPCKPALETLNCLVASSRPALRQLLADTAAQWGWTTVVCNDLSDAQLCVVATCVQLAFVDLEGPEGAAFRPLVKHLSAERRVLLVVCGNEGDLEEEIWARQLGVWFYLLGEQGTNSIGLLCRDARTIEQQRSHRTNRQAETKASQWWERSTRTI